MLSEEKKKQIVDRIYERMGPAKCPMCNNTRFSLVNGYLTSNIQSDYRSIVIGSGQLIPTVAIVCTRCGFVSEHAVGALDLFEENEKKTNSNKETKNDPFEKVDP